MLIRYFGDLKTQVGEFNKKLGEYEEEVNIESKEMKMGLINVSNQIYGLATRDELDRLINNNTVMS